jgi:hypothetical protein
MNLKSDREVGHRCSEILSKLEDRQNKLEEEMKTTKSEKQVEEILLFAATLFRDSSVINSVITSNFGDQSLLINVVLYAIFGLRLEIFETTKLSRISRNFLTRE